MQKINAEIAARKLFEFVEVHGEETSIKEIKKALLKAYDSGYKEANGPQMVRES